MCGATDCPSCGPAQGYEVVRIWSARQRQWIWVSQEDAEEFTPEPFDEEGKYDSYTNR
jgi:hypothetical protein